MDFGQCRYCGNPPANNKQGQWGGACSGWIRSALGLKHMQYLAKEGYWLECDWDKDCPSPHDPDPDEWPPLSFTWEDHRYMLSHRELPTIYVSEPYDLYDEAFGEMAKLVEEGWDVRIVIDRSLWNPGRTIPIWMSREAD